MKKLMKTLFLSTIVASLLASCGLFSKTEQLKEIEIIIEGNPQEWAPFPSVENDARGDNTSIEIDISTVKAFTNNQKQMMYVLVESYIPIKEFTSLEMDLQYGEEIYRVAFFPDGSRPAVIAHKIGQDEWDDVTDLYGSQIAVDTAVEFSFPIEKFTDTSQLKIYDLRIMSGICCERYEWYAVDYIRDMD